MIVRAHSLVNLCCIEEVMQHIPIYVNEMVMTICCNRFFIATQIQEGPKPPIWEAQP